MDKKQKPKELMQRIESPKLKYLTALGSMALDSKKTEKEYNQHNNSEHLKVVLKQMNKLLLLMEFYNIDKDDIEDRWFKLAYHLAVTHEVGFKIAQPSGSKKKWDVPQLLGLVATIRLIIIYKPMSVSNACQIIKDRYFNGRSTTKKTIENKYGEALRSKTVNKMLYMTLDPKTGASNLEALKIATEMFKPENL